MRKTTFLLVDQEALPPVFAKVIEAKEYLRNSQASSTTEAARMAGISRSVFYKYKDAVYPYRDKNTDSIITIQVVLFDKPGVLMALISEFYRVGANILTINQNIPVNGKALVSISARIDHMEGSLDDLLFCLRQVDGVQSIGNIAGE
ncbi:MAG: ACT domain-containing protein [Clostridiales bacterium]|jgi:chorismate mutase|nr:ACT domain-containing protein [Clostridiales bacterium]